LLCLAGNNGCLFAFAFDLETGLTLGGHLLLTSLNFILLAVGYDILPVEFQKFPLQLTGETIAQRDYAWQYRNDDDPDHVTRVTVDTLSGTPIRGHAADRVVLFFTRSGENVFDRDVLLQMK
jgi:hypothetical protein